ncbi:hypothetical protein B0A52_04403 [Exophiala mesophila]|uniref:Translin-associated protein X n=1 Tax=Exophiala mesophila TaxID=212818 RepID=A0A438N9B0_EXOME|nr:hypothetical protein B0A52_04403 [Exophiala mesophila]
MEIASSSSSPSPYIPLFESYRSELDQHHDRREKIIKASRDITAQSKKIIFALQRVRDLGRPVHGSIAKQIDPMYATINTLFESIVPDLQGINAHRYRGNITGGIQEFMEAVLFHSYLETQCVLSPEAAQAKLPQGIVLTHEDYILGIFDMTGELMRFAITYMATNGKLPGSTQDSESSSKSSILTDMQALRNTLELMDPSGTYPLSKEFYKKLSVTRTSVEKVENGVYSMIVRGQERPKGWRPDTNFSEGMRESDQIEGY